MEKFQKLANTTLNDLSLMIEDKFPDVEIDFEDGNLVIESELGNFIVSPHFPTSQLWLSSPISGAHHFEQSSPTASGSSSWISTRDKTINLFEILQKELS